jgi:exosortase/archaeosortase family protein
LRWGNGQLLLLAQVFAFWPIWVQYVRRSLDGWEEPWGLLSLATALVLLWSLGSKRRDDVDTAQSERGSADYRFSMLVMLIYAVSYPWAIPLLRSILAFSALALTLSVLLLRSPLHLGLWGLLLLSLPVMIAMDFCMGYPLRAIVTQGAAWTLRSTGLPVIAQGACIQMGIKEIYVDAPCSGIKMLWVGAYLCCTLVSFLRLGNPLSVIAFGVTFLLVMFGNILRAVSLFYIEADILVLPVSHDAVGLTTFALTAIAITACIMFLRRYSKEGGNQCVPGIC